MYNSVKRFFRTYRMRKIFSGYLYILPWLIGTVAFFLYPVYKSLDISLSRITSFVGLQTEWVGLANYSKLFTVDVLFIPNFISVVRDTILNIPLIVIFSLFIAVMANKKIKMRGFFRGVFVLPFLLGSGIIFSRVVGLDVSGGVTTVSRGIMIPEPVLAYMGARFTEIIQMFLDRITLIILKSPIQVIVFLGALQTIPAASYESAKCDGATEWEMFWKITLPVIVPQILFNIIFTMVEAFTDLSNPVLSNIMNAWFGEIYSDRHSGYGMSRDFALIAAKGWVYLLFIILLVSIVFIIWRHIRKEREYI